jgi:D-alanyl-D-alanine carboxypeptidase/D-alanyl-D-alanine-endopeptidase (penicillin-binding protein 4)
LFFFHLRRHFSSFSLCFTCILGLVLLGFAPWANASPGLPPEIAAAFTAAQVPSSAMAIVVEKLDGPEAGQRLLTEHAELPMTPASVMKLLTTGAALDLLGPAFTWHTEFRVTSMPVAGVLVGPLYLVGSGAPKLSLEEFWLLLRQLRLKGVRHIQGNLIIDRTLFALAAHDPAAFDGKPLRPYNTGADAALINFHAVRLLLTPDEAKQQVTVLAETPFTNLRLNNRLHLARGECGDWLEKVHVQAAGTAMELSGTYPQSCGEHHLDLSPFTNDAQVEGLFRALWDELGGTLDGKVASGVAPADSMVIAAQGSQPLAEAVRDINKFSNNVMARQLFLALSAEPPPATYEKSAARLKAWLLARGIAAPELIIANGAGLSRTDRVSANTLAALLRTIWKSPTMPEMMASLPIFGVDGTMKKCAHDNGTEYCNSQGLAHLKTGSIDGVRALAGYLLDRRGGRWLLVTLVNHANAARAKQGMDRLVQWVICLEEGETSHPEEAK